MCEKIGNKTKSRYKKSLIVLKKKIIETSLLSNEVAQNTKDTSDEYVFCRKIICVKCTKKNFFAC